MHDIDPSIDFSFLLGLRLIQVCFGANEVILNLEESAQIVVENDFRVRTSSTDFRASSDPAARLQLLTGLDATVASVAPIDEKRLQLVFSSSLTLELVNDSAAYECFAIRARGREIIV